MIYGPIIIFHVRFPKKQAHVEFFCGKKNEKRNLDENRSTFAFRSSVAVCLLKNLVLQMPSQALPQFWLSPLQRFLRSLNLQLNRKMFCFFFKVGLTLNIMIFKCFFFSKSFFVVFFTSSPKKSPRFLLRDHQWLGYISGCFPFMNVFQALASMLYLSAAVECDDAGCKDVGATRSKCFS